MAVYAKAFEGSEDDIYPEGSEKQLAQLDDGDDEIEAPVLDALASHIKNQFEINKRDRTSIEQEMMRAQEAVNNQYDAQTLAGIKSIGGSEVFIPLTSMQCNAGASWLLSVLNPPGDKAFTLKPTPIPELPATMVAQLEQDVKQTLLKNAPKVPGSEQVTPMGIPADQDGNPIGEDQVNIIVDKEAKELRKKLNNEAVKRAERMEGMIQDQLLESGWYESLEEFISDLVTFPTAFIKTSYEYRTEVVTTTTPDGNITMEAREKLVAKDERVSPFDIYPSPDQKTVHDGNMIERLKTSRSEIYACLDKPGYSNENILAALREVGTSSTGEWSSSVESTRRTAENHSSLSGNDDGSLYGLRYLGSVSIDKMLEWGYSIEDLQEMGVIDAPLSEDNELTERLLLKEIDIDAILIGNYVIKAVPNLDPEGKRPFYAASYRKVPGSFWGKSVAMLATPHQRMVNACARALSNNMGISASPQIVVYVDRLPNGESLDSIKPMKIWQMTSDPSGGGQKPIDFFQPSSNANELMGVYQQFFESVGDVTGIPRAAYSTDPSRTAPGAQTASGLAMMLETASKQIKQAVRNIDTGVIESRIKYQFRTNMMDPEIPNAYKGDMQVQAIGAKSIVAKAVENQRNVELLQATANPLDMELLGKRGRAKLLGSIARNYDMDGIVPTEDEIDEMEARAAQQAKQEQKAPTPEEAKLQAEQIKAKARIEDQTLENEDAERQRELDMQLAEMSLQQKQIELQIAQVQAQKNQEAKLREVALKETNKNARFKAEMSVKQQTGTGI